MVRTKTPIQVTIDTSLFDWAQNQIEEGVYANMSHAVNTGLKELRRKGTLKL